MMAGRGVVSGGGQRACCTLSDSSLFILPCTIEKAYLGIAKGDEHKHAWRLVLLVLIVVLFGISQPPATELRWQDDRAPVDRDTGSNMDGEELAIGRAK
jgi:K+-transporting ATPase A subunit